MRKHFKVGVVAVLALVLALSMALVGCGGSSSSSSSDSSGSTELSDTGTVFSEKASTPNDADADGVLVVGFDQEFPPYGFVADDGKFTGFDLELAKEVAARNGWDFKAVPINWDSKDLELSNGSIDCIWNGFTIEGREDGYTFTSPYMNNTQVVVVKADSGITTLADLAGKKVETQKDSSAYNLLQEDGDQADLAATFGSLQAVSDYNTAFMDLEQGACDAVAIDQPVANFQTADKPQYMILEETLTTEHYGVGFLLGNTAEAEQVEKTLKEMDADGFVKSLCETYSDQGISYDNWCL
jgi:polar amino acid transport system substrate-binding protein